MARRLRLVVVNANHSGRWHVYRMQNSVSPVDARRSITIGELCLAIAEGRVPSERLGPYYAVRDVDLRELPWGTLPAIVA